MNGKGAIVRSKGRNLACEWGEGGPTVKEGGTMGPL